MVISDAVQTLERELRDIFGSRLQSLVVYGQRAHAARTARRRRARHTATRRRRTRWPSSTSLTADDLRACAGRVDAWHDAGPRHAAAARRRTSSSSRSTRSRSSSAPSSPTTRSSPARTRSPSLAVDPADLRRACEVQARSHLLHLREGFLETRGRADALAVLIVQSAAAFAALVTSIARLEGHAADDAGVGGAPRRARARHRRQRGQRGDAARRRPRHPVRRRRAPLPAVSRRRRARSCSTSTAGARWSLVVRRRRSRSSLGSLVVGARAARAGARAAGRRPAPAASRPAGADRAGQRLRAASSTPTARARSTA